MDAATAAIIASAITGTVAVTAATLGPYLTARHTRQEKLLEMTRDAYVNAIRVAEDLWVAENKGKARDLKTYLQAGSLRILAAQTRLELLGSPDIAELYNGVYKGACEMASAAWEAGDKVASEPPAEMLEATKNYIDALNSFISAARADMGIAERYHDDGDN